MRVQPLRGGLRPLLALLLQVLPLPAWSQGSGWSVGWYGGQYYDTEPAGFLNGRANFQNHALLALTASKTVWRSQTLPLSLDWDGMLGQQFGVASFTEIALAPVLRWSRFPWNEHLQTNLGLGPLGLSYTTEVSPLERGAEGKGSQWLNFLLIELAFSRPQNPSGEVFLRLHHRCAIYDLVNNYGANGEDFFALGWRYKF
jgi:hypothetical protein